MAATIRITNCEDAVVEGCTFINCESPISVDQTSDLQAIDNKVTNCRTFMTVTDGKPSFPEEVKPREGVNDEN